MKRRENKLMDILKKYTVPTLVVSFGVSLIVWVWIVFLSSAQHEASRDVAMLIYFSFLGCLISLLPFLRGLAAKIGDSSIGTFFKPLQNSSRLHLQDLLTFVGELGVLTYISTLLNSYFQSNFSNESFVTSIVIAAIGSIVMLTLAFYSLVKLMEQTRKAGSVVVRLLVFFIGGGTMWFHAVVILSNPTH